MKCDGRGNGQQGLLERNDCKKSRQMLLNLFNCSNTEVMFKNGEVSLPVDVDSADRGGITTPSSVSGTK